ncbi:hypothetical protein S83_070613, partial [Arachis hypogaea]
KRCLCACVEFLAWRGGCWRHWQPFPEPSPHFLEIPLTASTVAANPNHSSVSATSSFSPPVTPAPNT